MNNANIKHTSKVLPSAIEKRVTYIKNLSDLTVYESGWEDHTPGKGFGPYKWNYPLLHFVIEGEGIHIIGNKKYHVKANQAFLIPPNIETTHVADAKNPWKYFWIGFDCNQSKDLLELCGFGSNRYVIPFDDIPLIKQMVLRLNDVRTNQVAYEHIILGCLYEIIGILLFKTKKATPQSDQTIYVNSAKIYMQANIENKISISDVAKHIGLDRSYFARIFKKLTGKTPKAYLQDLRLSYSLVLLDQSDLTLKQVALNCGFNDYPHFYKSFLKVNKISPTTYRDSVKKDYPSEHNNK